MAVEAKRCGLKATNVDFMGPNLLKKPSNYQSIFSGCAPLSLDDLCPV